MIKAKFFSHDEFLTGFEIEGHSGSAPSGEDIICAAVSSAAYMAANTITEILSAKADIRVEDGYLYFVTEPTDEIQTVLKGLQLHLVSLSKDYPKNIKVTF